MNWGMRRNRWVSAGAYAQHTLSGVKAITLLDMKSSLQCKCSPFGVSRSRQVRSGEWLPAGVGVCCDSQLKSSTKVGERCSTYLGGYEVSVVGACCDSNTTVVSMAMRFSGRDRVWLFHRAAWRGLGQAGCLCMWSAMNQGWNPLSLATTHSRLRRTTYRRTGTETGRRVLACFFRSASESSGLRVTVGVVWKRGGIGYPAKTLRVCSSKFTLVDLVYLLIPLPSQSTLNRAALHGLATKSHSPTATPRATTQPAGQLR